MNVRNPEKTLKPGFHYYRLLPVTTRYFIYVPCVRFYIINKLSPVTITRQLGPLTQAVNSGSGNRA